VWGTQTQMSETDTTTSGPTRALVAEAEQIGFVSIASFPDAGTIDDDAAQALAAYTEQLCADSVA
jgi:hypothetical protein